MEALKEEEETLNIAEIAVNHAIKNGADEAEAFIYKGLTSTVNIERGQISKGFQIKDQGIGIRVILNKAIGFAYTNTLYKKAIIKKTAEKALKVAKASKPDEDWQSLPDKKPFSTIGSLFDDKVALLSFDELVNMATEMLKAVEETDKRVFPAEGGIGASCLFKAVANSNGVSCFDRGTVIECSLATIASEKGEVSPVCFEFNIERRMKIDPRWVGSEAARLAASSLKAKKAETKSMKVIFAHAALQQLLHYTLINAIKADYVQRSQSALQDKMGEKVASEKITIYDNGLLEDGLRTWKFDGEGAPQQKTLIIERGVLRGFIYDNYTARKEGKESTGNAFRAGYLSTPTVEPTNFHILPGKKTPEELIGEVDDGLLVYSLQGAHSSNPASGEFSVVATPAWRIRDGRIVHAVKGAMLAGNIFEVMKSISDIANNERKIGALVTPWILAENVKVIGK
ncbi:TldD/PmbA family protein [Candidatus Bathyarchaeota archaeon]|nr:TldD/PmbA family protein [Candidatus Bathyarchaeota archaeon]